MDTVKKIKESFKGEITSLNFKLQRLESLVKMCEYYETRHDSDLKKFIISEFKRLIVKEV